MTETARIDALLSTLTASKEHERELLEKLGTLLRAPDLAPHVARVVTRAREVFADDAVHWLATPHWSLAHQMPLRIAQDPEGAARAEDLLVRIGTGMPV